MRHLLHERIGEIIQNELEPKGFIVKLDKACAINKNKRTITNNPLFIDKPKGNDTEITNVDILCYKMDKIKLICEIEESDRTPIRLFGKYYTAKAAKYWKGPKGTNGLKKINNKESFIRLFWKYFTAKESFYFLQVVKDDKKQNSKKRKQWRRINKALNNYKLIYGDIKDFKVGKEKYNILVHYLQKI